MSCHLKIISQYLLLGGGNSKIDKNTLEFNVLKKYF